MKTVNICASSNYNVYIEKGLLDRSGTIVAKLVSGRRAVIISDSNVAPLYGDRVKKSLEESGFTASLFVVKAGEESKNPENLICCADYCIDSELTRSDVIVALGGGVITDMAGLCGALYQRGIAVVQIPTSLLAMVDSSVGGKTAVNLSKGKNMFGAFYQPSAVLCDTDVLQTLPAEEMSNGFAEIIKYAVLRSGKLTEMLQDDVVSHMDEIVEECVKIKRDYVCADEFDRGERQFLNLGHTVGHAIERSSNFSVAHGSAVAAGMCIVARACTRMNICDSSTTALIEELCRKYSLPTNSEIPTEELYGSSLSDKKREGAEISLVMIKGIGNCYLHRTKTDFLMEVISKGKEETL
ncbi:MAG: 3-dehydroquinate synthase [Ruminococcus sp.]|nr:3-dehydroquinate synthase [Ruminococcus sp.]